MIEPEIAFADYFKAMDLGENLLKFIAKKILNNYLEELKFLENYFKTNLIENLQNIIKKKFNKFNFGDELSTEHEKYLAEIYEKGPIYIYDYPYKNSSFYMYKNNDNKTVRGFDLLVPKIGELIGGSQREDNYEKLINIIKEKKLELKELN